MEASNQRDIASLTFNDLAVHPVWTWAEEDDESLVEPVENIFPIKYSTPFLFGDGQRLEGQIE